MSTSSIVKELNRVLPPNSVLSDIEECYVYSADASNLKDANGIADLVVFVESIEEVQQVVKIAKKYNIPVICRGAGTNTVGACIPVSGGIILNFSRMNKILELNTANMTVRVQPGVVVGDIQKAADEAGLFYPPDPSNLNVSTIGGSIAQNSAGARCFKYGATKDYVLDLLVVTADGKLLRTGSNTIKNSSGYNMSSLFVGSEGTLGIVVEATLKLIPKPLAREVVMAYFDSTKDAVNAVNKIIEYRIFPSTIDFMDSNAMSTVEMFYPTGLMCEKEAALIIEVDGAKNDVITQRSAICALLRENNASNLQYSTNAQEADNIWAARRSSMAACAKLKPNVTTDDIIVPRQNLEKLIKGVQEICARHNLNACLVGHVGDGSVHPQIPIDYNDEKEYKAYKIAKSEIYQLAINLGGTISGEHGIGLVKKEYLSRVIDADSMNYMRTIKKVFDPDNILNPYKIF